MIKLTPPKAPVPIGLVMVNGQLVDVQQHPEFSRFFFDLFRRVGGTESISNADLYDLLLSLDDASSRVDALASQIGALRHAFESLQAGEMITQRVSHDTTLPDVMQYAQADGFANETTFYG